MTEKVVLEVAASEEVLAVHVLSVVAVEAVVSLVVRIPVEAVVNLEVEDNLFLNNENYEI
ncbi:hypothetical protein [Hoylesella saccharolytica]|uniref:hypothetical protein n=1 Tax=Hoylesella saccharolytica TaxID=633701 RepID=UPI0006844FE8|nr:hypothetical protein [Hoylesella saccharolytica]